ncbi:MAG TPA: hypothetical protein DCE42_15645 [Myxococcales bacterium]|nr:hypothetical protein [Deltaproteobacteria bacterium]HAA56198.1 hypothetical protein [Myxococcales bacterium]
MLFSFRRRRLCVSRQTSLDVVWVKVIAFNTPQSRFCAMTLPICSLPPLITFNTYSSLLSHSNTLPFNRELAGTPANKASRHISKEDASRGEAPLATIGHELRCAPSSMCSGKWCLFADRWAV